MNSIELLEETLSSLKDFQRATVNALMQKFNHDGMQRMLVADEVGLGKTIVAKGVIAELLKARLAETDNLVRRPLRVTYICSNLALANENRNKLAVFSGEAQAEYVKEPSYSRLLEIAVNDNTPADNRKILEVCSLTPSTSFNLTRGHGNKRERLIIYFALICHESLSPSKRKLSNFFRGGVGGWQEAKKYFKSSNSLDSKILKEFHRSLSKNVDNKDKEYCHIESQNGSWLDFLLAFCSHELKFEYESRVRACIRSMLARACAKHLTADLFILDEFQRFKALLDTQEDNDESLVAREIFNNKQKTKVLLLSATPFKAISQASDDEKGDAHADELNYLLRFISNSDQVMMHEYEKRRHALQQQILSLRDPSFLVSSLSNNHKAAIERILKNYICRTERVQISEDYEELFVSLAENCSDEFSRKDIESFKAMDQLGQGLQKVYHGRQTGQLMEFYKSAPWALSFLSGYQFKVQLDRHRNNGLVKGPLRRSDNAWLSRTGIQHYQIILANAPHAKTRLLVKKIFKNTSEEMLWVPPSLPHYPLQGSFEKQENFSKTLLFSSWAMVPRALSGLISYEAERRLLLNQKGVEKAYYKKMQHSPKIKFEPEASLAGWSLVYPSKIMKDMPINGNTLALTELLNEREADFRHRLVDLQCYEEGPNTRDRWYALAPMLLDLLEGHNQYVEDWLNRSNDNAHKGRQKQLKELSDYLISYKDLHLGPMPADLAEYLALLSITGPAVSVARTWDRNWPEESEVDISSAATEVAFSVVAMFNKPESESILNKRYNKHKYFKAIVHYCADGGFQAVIDEYGHLLQDAGLPMYSRVDNNSYSATGRLNEVMGFRTSTVACQFREDKRKSSDRTTEKGGSSNKENKHSLRCHYAVPLGNQKTSDEQGVQRIGNVRDAFNSPFRPFMLNSTSIGQEGLDFHWYCHHIVHWNLPSNPIDIEQREGRVNRYKSLVVRKRVAQQFRQFVEPGSSDPWFQLFKKADEITKKNGRKSDLIPYWHLPGGDAKIERFVPMMPMSKDVARFDNALKMLALYRLAFGQPRQEELLENLLKRDFSKDEIEQIKKSLVINLSPLMHSKAK